MVKTLIIEYFLFTSICSFATLQIVASLKKRGEWRILKNEALTIVLSLVLVIASFWWFFTIRNRNVHTALEGAQLSTVFGWGAFFSLVVTKLIKKLWTF